MDMLRKSGDRMRFALRLRVLAPGLLSAAALLLLPEHGAAADSSVEFAPGRSTVAIRTYGMGLMPLDGQFSRFHGRFTYDPDDHAHCSVALQVDVASLAMDSAAVGETVRGPDFLNSAQFPALAYQGACTAEGLTGRLTMHGVTAPFALTLDWKPDGVVATGGLQRADWGMTAMPILVGATVRIEVSVHLAATHQAGR